jgi:hypothetical protein
MQEKLFSANVVARFRVGRKTEGKGFLATMRVMLGERRTLPHP